MLVEVPLADAVRLLTAQVVDALGDEATDLIEGDTGAVTVRARVEDRLESLEVDGSAFLDGLSAAGAEVDGAALAALEALSMTITYGEPPATVPPVETPPAASVVALGDEATGC